MEFDMIYKQKRNLIISQVIGAILGLLLGITSQYDSFWNVLARIIFYPIALAALSRFCVRTYQVVKVKLGTKVYDSTGDYLVVERRGRGVAAAIIAPFLVVGIISTVSGLPWFLQDMIILAVITVGAFFCYKDIRFFVNFKRELNEQQKM